MEKTKKLNHREKENLSKQLISHSYRQDLNFHCISCDVHFLLAFELQLEIFDCKIHTSRRLFCSYYFIFVAILSKKDINVGETSLFF